MKRKPKKPVEFTTPMAIDDIILKDLSCNLQRTEKGGDYLVGIGMEKAFNPAHNSGLAKELIQMIQFKTLSMQNSMHTYQHPLVPADLILLG